VKNKNAIDYSRGTKDFHFPVCFWSGHGWFISWGDVVTFDPLHGLDDAWKIMDHFKPGRVDLKHVEQESHDSFMHRSLFENRLDNIMHRWWSWTQEELCGAICFAALKSMGLEIEP
jgi:hypothetical protein